MNVSSFVLLCQHVSAQREKTRYAQEIDNFKVVFKTILQETKKVEQGKGTQTSSR